MGPLPDDGIRFYFNLRFYLNIYLDVKMASPPALSLQGSSHTVGGILWGKAYGNKPNHADLALEGDSSDHMLMKSRMAFKIFVHVEFGEALAINRVPDFESQVPITVFMLQGTSLLAKPLLKRAVQFHASISGKYYLLLFLLLIDLKFICCIASYVFFSFCYFWPLVVEYSRNLFSGSWNKLKCTIQDRWSGSPWIPCSLCKWFDEIYLFYYSKSYY